jgi:transcriptional regulator with XRE-family HTH domain
VGRTTSPLTIALGRAIRSSRVEQEITQDTLGVRSQIHPTWISHIESGRVNPTIGNVARIANGLGLTLSELISRAEEIVKRGKAPKAMEAEIRWRPIEKEIDGIDQG